MTPDFRPFLEDAIEELPHEWQMNTYASCYVVLTRALFHAGPDWAYIGKVDSESGYAPPGFTPIAVRVTRPDGQPDVAYVMRLSHDAVWHVPSLRQVKAIVNSAANSDERPEIHGPAQIGGDVIAPESYRYRNPPITYARINGAPVPVPPKIPPFPPRDVVVDFVIGSLSRFYQQKGRPVAFEYRGQFVYVDFEGIVVWMAEYLRRVQLGESGTDASRHVLEDVAAAWR